MSVTIIVFTVLLQSNAGAPNVIYPRPKTSIAVLLDDVATWEAVNAGERNEFNHLVSGCRATAGALSGSKPKLNDTPTGAFIVTVSLAPGRIALLANEAKRMNRNFSAEKVPASMRSLGTVFVTAVPESPRGGGVWYTPGREVPSTINQIILRSKTVPNEVIPADRLEFTSVEWPEEKRSSKAADATFPLDAVQRLPPGEFDVVLVTQHGERRCKVGRSDRARLFQ